MKKCKSRKGNTLLSLPMAYDRSRSMYYMEIKRITDESANNVAKADPAPPTKTSTEIKMLR